MSSTKTSEINYIDKYQARTLCKAYAVDVLPTTIEIATVKCMSNESNNVMLVMPSGFSWKKTYMNYTQIMIF
jgi:hypothetical protein